MLQNPQPPPFPGQPQPIPGPLPGSIPPDVEPPHNPAPTPPQPTAVEWWNACLPS